MTNVFPTKLLAPRAERWWLQGATVGGGVTVSGLPTSARTEGGGFWMCEQEIFLHSPAQIKAARAIEALLDGGATRIFVPAYEVPFAPFVGGGVPSGVPHSDGTPFSDGSLYVGQGVVATGGPAIRRATVFPATLSVAEPLQGGERFSIAHPTEGKRLYTVAGVGDTLTIRPPLREAIGDDTPLDFDAPGCVMRLANPDQLMSALDVAGHVLLKPVWVEDW